MAEEKKPKAKQSNSFALDWDTLDAARYTRDFPVKEKPKKKVSPQTS